MKKLILLLFLSNLGKSFAQNFTFQYNNSFKIVQNGQSLPNTFAGGLNAPQFSTCNLDNDGVEDLVIFDRTSSKLSTFLAKKDNTGKYYWQYAPEYETAFPAIQHWILLVDYDSDGKKDIFTYTPAGIKVYRNVSTDKIAWELITDPLYSTGYSGKINLYTASTDIPAIVDIDNDGDYDIVAFDSSGNFLLFHKNFSQENYKDNNHLEFKRIGDCWGNFFKEHFDDARFNQDCGANVPVGGSTNNGANGQKVEHSGNALLVLDLDGDGLKDALYGHISANRVAALSNNGSSNQTIFTKADYFFPNPKPIDFSIFPAIFYEDVDFDGIKDIIAAPNGYDNALQTVDYQNAAWFYKNNGQNNNLNLTFQQANFLQNTMVDVGENASPVLADIDGDGDKDLLVGNAGNRGDNGYRANITLYENKGNNTFELKTTDFLDLSKSQQLFEIKPFVTDMNGDGTDDFGFTANTFNGMTIQYIPNKAARNQAFSLKLSEIVSLPKINNLSNGDSPLFFDLDNDGKKDLLIGKGSGRIEFHKNTGSSTSPIYTLTKEELGGLTSDYLSGNVSLTVADLNGDGKAELITGNRDGTFKVFKNIIGQSQDLFKEDSSGVLDEFTGKYAHLKLGGMLSITVGDLDGDVIPDFIVGTNAGGLKFLKGTTKFTVTGNEESKTAVIYPNPTNHFVYIKNNYLAEYQLIDFTGKTLSRKNSTSLNEDVFFDLSNYSNGTYFIRIIAEGKGMVTEKVLLSK
ncbi:FG-GAP-like repeat-containing protein [Arcicella aquatica]|uniref:FG-GAP-like repeat-containing protein n=1 Tax=Arcicella aquatica TaxID=217141 RepID=A0ABU5QKV7_9BACT|nr:FG-GAP-like repeat-containing protein [Arcicella aquatica]MEA5257570.1 FG-GAP-like repeat-containing protein [Arcicella aquatica]